MKNRIVFLIPISALLIVAAILLVLNRRATPSWESRLDQYLAYMRKTSQLSLQVVATTPAISPAKFSPAMSGETFSDSIIFQTTHTLSTDYSADLIPIPYPPNEVMCVLLKTGSQHQLVYVALHNSLYNADWIVHVSPDPWGSSILQSSLDAIGCSLDT